MFSEKSAKKTDSFQLKVFQKGFNFSQDGPGNRLIYHLQGCNFFCPWCSNPEGMTASSDKMVLLTDDDILQETLRCRPLFFGNGGVTFTGGECTLQHHSLLSCLKKLKENGIHTCIETNASDPCLDELLPFIDYLIADLKHTDSIIHKKYTGCENSVVLENFEKIFASSRQLLLRIPLINGVNTDPTPFIEFFGRHNMSSTQIEVLTYHEFGKNKWTKPYTIENGFVDKTTFDTFKNALKAAGFSLLTT